MAEKMSRAKKITMTILSILLLAAMGWGFWYLWQWSKYEKEVGEKIFSSTDAIAFTPGKNYTYVLYLDSIQVLDNQHKVTGRYEMQNLNTLKLVLNKEKTGSNYYYDLRYAFTIEGHEYPFYFYLKNFSSGEARRQLNEQLKGKVSIEAEYRSAIAQKEVEKALGKCSGLYDGENDFFIEVWKQDNHTLIPPME